MTAPHTHKIRFIAFAILAMISVWAFSCKKKAGDANAKFLGTYHGTNCKDSTLPDVVVTAGKSGSLISVAFTVDTGACTTNIGVIGSINGNNITFANQSFDDLCGNAIIVSGTGSLNGSTLTLNLSGLSFLSGTVGLPTGTYCFMGTK